MILEKLTGEGLRFIKTYVILISVYGDHSGEGGSSEGIKRKRIHLRLRTEGQCGDSTINSLNLFSCPVLPIVVSKIDTMEPV